jgi:hypothetical protein
VKDQRSASKRDDEPPRPQSIPDYFVWCPEIHAWDAPPGESPGWDAEAWLREFREELANLSEEERRKGLISVDELRAAGAFDVPASWRKSLGTEQDLFSDLLQDDSPDPKKRSRVEVDTDDEASADGDT